MQFTYNTEPDGQIHLTKKHGISTSTVEAAFNRPMRQWKEGNALIRLGKTDTSDILKIVFKWITEKQHVYIITAYYFT